MASVYQKIHAFALKAQARHRLQLKGYLHQKEAANLTEIYRIDCTQQSQWQEEFDNLEMQEPLVVPHKPQHNPGKNISYASDLNDSTNPIDKVIPSLRYSSIPHFLFESHSKPNQQSRKCVVRSEDGWFEDLEENVWTGPTLASKTTADSGHIDSSQILEIDSDTDSSSSAPSTDSDSEAEHWLRMTEDAIGGCHWQGLDEKLSPARENEVQNLTKDPTVLQNIPLKGMARLRRISPRAIKTVTLEDTSTIQAERT